MTITLYNSTYFLRLDADYDVRFGSALGAPEARTIFSEPFGRGFAPLAAVNYGNRTAPLSLRIFGTSQDDWIVQSRQIHNLLNDAERYQQSGGSDGDQAFLSVQFGAMTNAIEYEVLRGDLKDDGFAQPSMTITGAPYLIDVPLVLVLRPFGRPQALTSTLTSALTLKTDYAYTTSGIPGDRETPLKLTLQLQPGDTMGRALVGRRTANNLSNFHFALEAEPTTFPDYQVSATGSGTTYAVVSSTAAHGENLARITWTATGLGVGATGSFSLTWTLTAHLEDQRGRFAVFVNMPVRNAGFTTAQLSYGGSSGDRLLLNAIAPVSGLNYLGIIDIPAMDTPPSTPLQSMKLRLTGYTSGASVQFTVADIDNLWLMPIDEQYLDVPFSTVTAAADQLVDDNLSLMPSLSVVDSSGDAKDGLFTNPIDSRFTLKPGIANGFYAITARTTSSGLDLTDSIKFGLDYWPQYDLFR